jgi:hypothetical protein
MKEDGSVANGLRRAKIGFAGDGYSITDGGAGRSYSGSSTSQSMSISR